MKDDNWKISWCIWTQIEKEETYEMKVQTKMDLLQHLLRSYWMLYTLGKYL